LRKRTKIIQIGGVWIGGEFPVAVQSMTNSKTTSIEETVEQINLLVENGCDIVRCAVPDRQSVKAFRKIKERVSVPLVADIHFNHNLALLAIEAGADKIRINPGNIGSEKNLKEIIKKADDYNIPVRIGINSGSLEKDILEKYKGPTAEALVESALRNTKFFENEGFNNIVVSLKSSDVVITIEAYKEFSKLTDYPLHIGVTEAGTPFRGIIKSAVGIGMLLYHGIGDTIRVSLTGNPVEEVRAAKQILRSLHLSVTGIDLISCPTCGRVEVDLLKIVTEVEKRISHIKTPLKVAVMGCVVNGPGEAKDADLGIACGKGYGLLFKKGEIVEKISEDKIVGRLVREINNWKTY